MLYPHIREQTRRLPECRSTTRNIATSAEKGTSDGAASPRQTGPARVHGTTADRSFP